MAVLDALNKLLGDPNEKELKKLRPLVQKVKDRIAEQDMQSLTAEDLPKKTEEFKEKITNGASVDDLMIDAFAVGYRACELIKGKELTIGNQKFVWNMVPYDVQILGGIALHKGMITEMKTGEGKTLVCTLPVYLNALTGKGVHLITVNDYLAKRDSAWMGLLYEALGLTVGTVVHDQPHDERKNAYNCDVTYGTNNEFGFDYLRDNMAPTLERQVQRPLHYAIVDEVDSILIDEARTPLIISQPASESTEKYGVYASYIKNLQENVHYNKDEKQRTATLTEEGVKKMEEILGVENIYTEKGFEEVHHIEQSLRANAIFQKDVDYVVRDGQVIIVDEFTGRLMPGRRYSNGLHQAIEAKEGVEVQRESKTLATITFQNYFRIYEKLAGMTGTAKTEEEEFESIYKLRTLVIPTNKEVIREDKGDAIYRTVQAKFTAVAKIAKEKHAKGQPVLIGTTSIDKSEALSAMLNQLSVPHSVLNAKHHEKEAEIVAGAGQKGAITIATNMAGRGTDIKLGDGVADLGGLVILGTERHESRRIDNQLRGRAGRQGDPGETQFFVSMEDDLMRLFGGERMKNIMTSLKLPDDVPLQNPMVSRSIESAQKKVEGHNFDIRRHVVRYDDVMNRHRSIIYERRQKILQKLAADQEGEVITDGPTLHDDIVASFARESEGLCAVHAQENDPESWNAKEIHETLHAIHPQVGEMFTEAALQTLGDRDQLITAITEGLTAFYAAKCKEFEPKAVQQAERVVVLRSIDMHWMEHIDEMTHLREQVAFSGFAQRDPLIEYKDQAFRKFEGLLARIDSAIIRTLFQSDFRQFTPRAFIERTEEQQQNLQTNEAQIEGALQTSGAGDEVRAMNNDPVRMPQPGSPVRVQAQPGAGKKQEKIGRNDPCPCGSGKKYKKCHGKDA